MPELSLLVLTRNSEAMVQDGLDKICSYLEGCSSVGKFEVLVCDYSQDATPELVRQAAGRLPQVRYCGAGRPGIGAGIRAGLAAARLEYAMTYPIDMAWDLEVIKDSVDALLEGADMVFGSRYASGSSVRRPALRRLFSFGYRVLVQAMFGLGVRDLNGTLAVRMSAVRRFEGDLCSNTAFLPTEMAVEARARGLGILEIPCTVADMRNNSIIVASGHTRDMLRDMLGKKRRGSNSSSYGDFSTVKEAEVGDGTVIRGHCDIYGARIGRDCKVNAMVYMEPGVSVGDRVTLRPGCHICEGVTIGDDVFLGPYVCTTNDLYPSKLHVAPLKTTICDGAVIGAGAVLLPVRIGVKAFVAAGAVVTRDVPDYAVVAGSPARTVGSTQDASFAEKQRIRDAGGDPRGGQDPGDAKPG